MSFVGCKFYIYKFENKLSTNKIHLFLDIFFIPSVEIIDNIKIMDKITDLLFLFS